MLQNYRQLEQCRQAGEDKRKTEFCVHYMIKKSIKEIYRIIQQSEKCGNTLYHKDNWLFIF